jgi:hypothetical protein
MSAKSKTISQHGYQNIIMMVQRPVAKYDKRKNGQTARIWKSMRLLITYPREGAEKTEKTRENRASRLGAAVDDGPG